MESVSNRNDDISDDEDFTIENITAIDKDLTIQRLKEYSYYLTEEVETNLEFCLKLLEDRNVPVKSNSKYVTVLSRLASAVPKVGSGLGAALSQTEIFFLNRIDKNNSRTVADLVYYYNDNKDIFRNILIESAFEIFYSFEDQFRKLNCNGGERRAMQKLAKNASQRMFNYLLEMKLGKNITKMDVVKGIMQGESKTEKTVKNNDKKWKTSKIYAKTGIFIPETGLFYKPEGSHPEKYGHRRPFKWETQDDIQKSCKIDATSYTIPDYFLTLTEELLDEIKNYILSKDTLEMASFERENYYQKLSEEAKKHHEEIMKEMNTYFADILAEMVKQLAETSSQQETQTIMLEKVLNNQDEHKIINADITTKLDIIHKNVEETQITLTNTTTEIKDDINVIKSQQTEIRNDVVNHDELKSILETQSLKNQLKQILKESDPGPSIKKEIEQGAKEIQKGAKNIENEVRKVKGKLKLKKIL